MNEISALIKETPEGFLIPSATEDTAGRQQSASQDHTLDTEWAGRHFDLGLLTSG